MLQVSDLSFSVIAPTMKTKFLIYDVETTGLLPRGKKNDHTKNALKAISPPFSSKILKLWMLRIPSNVIKCESLALYPTTKLIEAMAVIINNSLTSNGDEKVCIKEKYLFAKKEWLDDDRLIPAVE